MLGRVIICGMAWLTLVLAWAALPAVGAPSAEERAEMQAVNELMVKAAKLFTENKFPEAGEAVKEAQGRFEKVADEADAATLSQLYPMQERLIRAHALLKTKGVNLPDVQPLPDAKTQKKKKAKGSPDKSTPEKTTTTAKTAAGKAAAKGASASVSFVNDVAPILNNRCGGCHIRAARGAFQMNTYDMLMKGPPKSGKVIFPGDTKSSILIEKIVEKEMPPNGAGIPAAELTTLQKWVQEGAKFDGKDPAAQVTTYIAASTNATRGGPVATVQMATGKESVSFARDIAPIFVDHCVGCHGPQQPRNNFNLNTITSLIKGGDRGEPVLPGKAADSLIIKKLRGTAEGMRMPQRAPALPEMTIAKIEKWIDEGAKFDGPDANQPIEQVASIAKALASTHDQLSKDRAKMAEANWQLGMPGTKPSKFESANFLVMGNVGENVLADIAKRAEALAPKVADTFKAPRDQPLVKGRVTLFVFGERYDYGEFGKMVEKHDLPAASRGHFRFSVVDAYGVVLAPKGNEYDLDTLIAQQLAAVYVASLGKGVPHWFAEGCGRVVASRMAPASDKRVAEWDDELSGLVGSAKAADDFLKGKMPPESADICAASFAKFLMSERQFVNLMDALRKGAEFQKAFGDTMGGTPEKAAAVWIRNPPKMGRGGRKK